MRQASQGSDHRWSLVRVVGHSMEPTLFEGDLLLVHWGARPRPGIAVVRLPSRPAAPRPLSVKRVTGPSPDGAGWWVERDNPRQGVDSWLLGAISPGDVLARAVLRLPVSRIDPTRWRLPACLP